MEENEFERPLRDENAPLTETTEPETLDGSTNENTQPVAEMSDESEEEKTRTEEEILNATDGKEFAARYQSAKERDLAKLSKEMEERTQNPSKKKKWKTAVKVILMALLIGISVWLMFGLSGYIGGDNQKSFTEMLHTSFNWRYFLLFLAAIAAYMIFESLKYAYLLKISTGKWRLKISVKTMFLGKYYDGITPLGTGGQPFQIYYLHKRKVPAGAATAVPLVKYIISTYVLDLISAALLILVSVRPDYFQSAASSSVKDALSLSLIIISWVSLVVNFLIPTSMILLSAFPKVGKKIIAWIVKVLSKMHIVKHRYSVTKKYVYEVTEYRNALKLLVKKWYSLIPLVLISMAETFLYLSLPFFAVIAIAGVAPTANKLLEICCLSAISFFSVSMIPTPGNAGASEAATTFIFSTVTGIESVIGWVVFAWRFANFYLYILVGICLSVYSMIKTAVKAKRAKKQTEINKE